MKVKSLLMTALLAGTGLWSATPSFASVLLDTGSFTGAVYSFGYPDSQTYGQVFTAPVTGLLKSFTLYLYGDVGGDLFGGVGAWDGTAGFSTGGGVSSILYASPDVTTINGAAGYTFAPDVAVNAGSLYVAFLSVFGTNATSLTGMPLGEASDPLINYFVWSNSTDPNSNAWNYNANYGDVQFDAVFDSSDVPLPAGLPLLGAGLLLLAGLRRYVHKPYWKAPVGFMPG